MKKILLLEDEDIIGITYKKFLKDSGYYVLWATTAQEAEKIVKVLKPDIVLLDHGMPEGKKGIDIVPFLRKNLPDAKIIIISNYSKDRLFKKARRAGADDFLSKIDTPPEVLIEYLEKIS